jgi:hypothetical protein
MIHYPADIVFSSRESDMAANDLMRLLRRQLHWAQMEADELKQELEELERIKREEWTLKEVLLEGLMDSELSRAKTEGVFQTINARVRQAMEEDARIGKRLTWTQGTPSWRGAATAAALNYGDVDMTGVADRPRKPASRNSVSPRGAETPADGYDGDQDPYDNILAGVMAQYEMREGQRSMATTPLQTSASSKQRAAEVDAVGALLDMGKA